MVGERLEFHGFELDELLLTESLGEPHSDILFPDPAGYDLVLAMGAIWSVYDEEKIGSWIGRELDLIRTADQQGIPVLGICFGGQALAAALGGASVPATQTQVGWYEIDSDVQGLSSGPWMEWHYDQIEAPPGSEIVAKDPSCVQAFRIRKNLGTQFHPEVTHDHLKIWLDSEGEKEASSNGVDVKALLEQTKQLEPLARENTNRLVDWFLSDVAQIATVHSPIPATPVGENS